MDERPPHRPWEEDFGCEEQLLLSFGFHRVRGLEDTWQRERGKPCTRQMALKWIKENYDLGDPDE